MILGYLRSAKIVLEVPARREAIAGEPVQKRLGALASAFDRSIGGTIARRVRRLA